MPIVDYFFKCEADHRMVPGDPCPLCKLDAALEGQELLKVQTVRIRAALTDEPREGVDTELIARELQLQLPTWRIIADELPPMSAPVICWSPSGAEKLRMPMFVSYRFRDIDEGTPRFYHETPSCPVTHWMPLPEAPK